MPTSCIAVGCVNWHQKGSSLGFFRLPAEPKQRAAWIQAIRREKWTPVGHERLCSEHFLTGKPSTDPTHPDYIPTIFSFTSNDITTSTAKRVERHARATKRSMQLLDAENKKKRKIQEESSAALVGAEALLDLSTSAPRTVDTGTNTDGDPFFHENGMLRRENKQLLDEIVVLQREKEELKHQLEKCTLCSSALDDEKTQFYTGLPSYAVFLWLLSLVQDCLKVCHSMSGADQLLLTLMKLRLGLTHRDLSYRFNICENTVTSILKDTLPKIAMKLNFLIKWPTKQELVRNIPKSFKKRYSKCCVIIDFSEFFIERPYNLTARAQTWSHYKHHQTVKVLLGITPYGSVSFISKCWGGRVSDKEITLKSRFLDNIQHGDLVMADRGITIADDLAAKGATLAIPAFTRGRKQLPGKTVSDARQLSAVRIHVERAFERIKNYKILNNTLPITLVKYADDIILICSALTNLQPKLVN